jgi:hypothetical protein
MSTAQTLTVPAREEVHALYLAAAKADIAFQSELVRQFGAGRAGLLRYVSSAHDDYTACARVTYQWAIAAASEAFHARQEGC